MADKRREHSCYTGVCDPWGLSRLFSDIPHHSALLAVCGSYMNFVQLVKSRQRRASRLEPVVATDEWYVNVNCIYVGCIYDKQ